MRWFAGVIIAASLILTVSVVSASEGIISPLSAGHQSQPVVPSVDISQDAPLSLSGEPALLLALSQFFAAQAEVLSASTESAPPPTNTPTPTAPTPTAQSRSAKSSEMTVTLLGDSMMDTLGPDGAGLAARLQKSYPGTHFTVINHGVGAENIDSGVRRLTNNYSYLGVGRQSVISARPDVVVVESFGYNPYPLPDINDAITKHWLKLAEIVDILHSNLPDTKIVIAATIAPNWDTFGDGAPFISMSPEGKRTKTDEIKKYIESTIAFAKSQKLPLADAYHPSLDPQGNGRLSYINGGDHIHYSDSGRALMSQKIAETITANKLLE